RWRSATARRSTSGAGCPDRGPDDASWCCRPTCRARRAGSPSVARPATEGAAFRAVTASPRPRGGPTTASARWSHGKPAIPGSKATPRRPRSWSGADDLLRTLEAEPEPGGEMGKRILRRPSTGTVLGALALIVAIGGNANAFSSSEHTIVRRGDIAKG